VRAPPSGRTTHPARQQRYRQIIAATEQDRRAGPR
jgi:hypothetical protein